MNNDLVIEAAEKRKLQLLNEGIKSVLAYCLSLPSNPLYSLEDILPQELLEYLYKTSHGIALDQDEDIQNSRLGKSGYLVQSSVLYSIIRELLDNEQWCTAVREYVLEALGDIKARHGDKAGEIAKVSLEIKVTVENLVGQLDEDDYVRSVSQIIPTKSLKV